MRAVGVRSLALGVGLAIGLALAPEGTAAQELTVQGTVIPINGFGGPDMRTLNITAGKTLYRVRVDVAGLAR